MSFSLSVCRKILLPEVTFVRLDLRPLTTLHPAFPSDWLQFKQLRQESFYPAKKTFTWTSSFREKMTELMYIRGMWMMWKWLTVNVAGGAKKETLLMPNQSADVTATGAIILIEGERRIFAPIPIDTCNSLSLSSHVNIIAFSVFQCAAEWVSWGWNGNKEIGVFLLRCFFRPPDICRLRDILWAADRS